jgi:hypothetical protein
MGACKRLGQYDGLFATMLPMRHTAITLRRIIRMFRLVVWASVQRKFIFFAGKKGALRKVATFAPCMR